MEVVVLICAKTMIFQQEILSIQPGHKSIVWAEAIAMRWKRCYWLTRGIGTQAKVLGGIQSALSVKGSGTLILSCIIMLMSFFLPFLEKNYTICRENHNLVF